MSEKRYYSIGEVAEQLQVNASLLRFWEAEFKLAPRKNQRGDRRYEPAEVDRLRLIHQLVKQQGYTLQGAKDYLHQLPAAEKRRQEAIAGLTLVRQFLLTLREQLTDTKPDARG